MFIYTIKASSLKFFLVLILSVAALVTLISVIPNMIPPGMRLWLPSFTARSKPTATGWALFPPSAMRVNPKATKPKR